MLGHVWELHWTPKTIFSDQGSLFILQVKNELCKRLGIWPHLSTAYNLGTDGKSYIDNMAVEQYVSQFTQYYQDDWETLLPH